MSQRDILLERLANLRLQELESDTLPDVLGECFAEQYQFIMDTSKRKIACLTRRSGKSTAAGLYLINEALKNPGSKSVYVNLTKDAAKKVMWHDIFETIILKLRIPAELVGLEIRFANGSIIYLTGADSSAKEKHKLRGQKNILAVVDECQSFTTNLEELIISVILPTLADYNGTLCMLGTPGNYMGEHFWFKLNSSNSQYDGWRRFHWTWRDNPHVRENMHQQVNELIRSNPLIEKTTTFRQEYLGEWVIEQNARVYKSEAGNYIDQLPDHFLKGASYILSFDLGFNDATTFVVSAFNPNLCSNMYVLESEACKGLTFSAAAAMIKEYQKKYDFTNIVGDAANKQGIQEMVQIHSLPIIPAQKLGKEAHIGILNSDFITRNVFIMRPSNLELIKELETLLWDQNSLALGIYKENQTQCNDLCDALLYGHHYSRHWWFTEAPPELTPQEKQIKRIIDHVTRSEDLLAFDPPFWERGYAYDDIR